MPPCLLCSCRPHGGGPLVGIRLPKSRLARVVGTLAVSAAVAVLLVRASTSSEPSRASPAATPTVAPEIIANTIEDAFRLWSGLFTGYGSTLTVAKPESVSYAETTVGQ